MSDVTSIVEEVIDRWNAHDSEGFGDLVDHDFELEVPGSERQSGRTAWRGFLDLFNEGFPDHRIEQPKTLVGADWAVEESVFVGTHTGTLHGPAGDIPPTGRRVALPYVGIFRGVSDGKIGSAHYYWDQVDLLAQLGLLPAPPSDTGDGPGGALATELDAG